MNLKKKFLPLCGAVCCMSANAALLSVTVPADAELTIATKSTHFVAFTPSEPLSVEENDGVKVYTFDLTANKVYNYRTWMEGGITQAGYFTMKADPTNCPELVFTESDYRAYDPHKVNHMPQSNSGYETGDIFLNINPQGYLSLNVGDTYDAHAMRTWELTDNAVNNYFIEPDFHYTVIDCDGNPSVGVIEIENADTHDSPWSKITAVGKGTAIVLVTYDAIDLNYYTATLAKTEYLGGRFWGAIWPENTGVFVVTVGEGKADIEPNMEINETYNAETSKLSGKYVDAEHDVFYYLEGEDGARYTFAPEGVSDVTVAYPEIGEKAAAYKGFGSEGVTKNDDGSYTLLLRHGRQIVRMTDASGSSVYQVLTAKECRRQIVNASREGSEIFQPGDKIKIQYEGLFHPANKIAGIYNMSAYVTYNGIPNGSELIQGSGQYTFASAPSAQAVTIEIPVDYDVEKSSEIAMTEGVIQVNGYGDPIGNHRNTDPQVGRSPNFAAVAHKTYFGAIPDVHIPITAYREFAFKVEPDIDNAEIEVKFNEKVVAPNDEGFYTGTYGTYSVIAYKEGYRCYRGLFTIGDDAEGEQIFSFEMEPSDICWDGKTLDEPETDEDGVYQITKGSELAWLADHVNAKNAQSNACLTEDIDLGNYEWTPIGTSSSVCYSGIFDGQGHKITGLFIENGSTLQALFGYLKNGAVKGVTVYGSVTAKQYVAGIVGNANANAVIEACANYADVRGTGTYVGGVVGYLSVATASMTDCYNAGDISGTTNCGGVIGSNNKDAVVKNVFNVGAVSGTTVGAIAGGTTAKAKFENAFATEEYGITDGQTTVTDTQMRSGEIAYRLGKAFGQHIGVEEHPVLGGMEVLYDAGKDVYHNNEAGVEDVAVDVCADADGAVYYNLEGIASESPFKGFNIVRLPNGSARKIYVK